MAVGPYIGQMDRKIKIYEFSKVQNEVGEEKETKVLVASPYSFVEDTGGSESVDGKVRHAVSRSYVIRWNKQVSKQGVHFVVEDEGIEFHVESVMNVGRRKYLKLVVQNYS